MPRKIRPKGHHIGHGFGISPSADGNRPAVVSGHFPVSGQQGAQHRAVRRRPGRLFPFSRPGVCVRKPIPLTLRASVRKRSRRPGRPLCSPLPANPYALVSGSKIFTQLPAVKCIFARTPAGLFAPPCPQILMPSFRGAKSSHNCRPLNAFSPAHRPVSLLPPARKSLCPRFGEQKPLQRFRTAAGVSLFLYSSAIFAYILYACISTYSS